MDATKPYEFIGFGVMDATKPYEFTWFEVMDATKSHKFIELVSGARELPKKHTNQWVVRLRQWLPLNYGGQHKNHSFRMTRKHLKPKRNKKKREIEMERESERERE